jgi:flagellar motility protein MotE (MotC chaperone)
MKPILAFIAAFLVATGASTGVKVMTAKPVKADSAKVGVDSTTTDSTSKGEKGEKADHGEKTEGSKDTKESHEAAAEKPTSVAAIGKAPGFSASSTLVENGAKPVVKPATAEQQAPVATQPADSAAQASEQRLAKVFTAMEPKQAAKVLQHMQDADVQIILGYVGPRQAAAIMAELPPERVALLSKMAMITKGTK